MFETGSRSFAAAQSTDDLSIADAMVAPLRAGKEPSWRERIAAIDWAPDLSEDIGSGRWFRGLGTLTLLSVVALSLLPDLGPVYGAQPHMPTTAVLDIARTQTIMPIAYGSDTGSKMAANENVVALAASPERPRIEMTATLGQGDSFARVLQRAGVGAADVRTAVALVSSATGLGDIRPGTPIAIVLGRRTSNTAPRPLESLDFRARFDLQLAINRGGGALSLARKSIAVDDTPLRIRGTVGSSLYRAETGEVEVGGLLYAGIDRGGKPRIQMLKWQDGDSVQWFEASGVGETRGQMASPVNGRMTSGFGYRRHPILGYRKMHAGIDFGAPHGAPIYAATDGIIAMAGRAGGCGNAVKINHGSGLATRYCHMSRIAASSGQRVRQGQIIGYVGSTGLSTGPHLHYELYRNGSIVNPLSVKFTQRAQLSGGDLARFKGQLARLKSVKPGAALVPMGGNRKAAETPQREIDRISQVQSNRNRIG